MNKLTIVFIVITIVIVLILGTFLGIRYFGGQQEATQTEPQITVDEPLAEPEPDPEPEPEEQEEDVVADFPAIVSPFDTIEEPAEEPVYPNIDIKKVVDAGYKVANLVSEDFDGIIFKNIDISEYNDDNHKQFIITESEEFAGIITELIFPNPEIANEVYILIKTKITSSGNFEINETNQYGENSLFANNNEEKNSVFLVVKMGERLYTLYYPAKNHNKMKNLINLL